MSHSLNKLVRMTGSFDASDGGLHPTCFISYSHDSPAHKQAVVDLAQVLREEHGIDVMIDRYVEHSPPQYWPQWMVQQIEEHDFVIVVITETYARRFNMKEEPGVGLGVAWEGAVINSHIYRRLGGTAKFIPVIFNKEDQQHIPFPLVDTSRYLIEGLSSDQLSGLLHQLNQIPVVVPAPLGTSAAKLPSELYAAIDLANHDKAASIEELQHLSNSGDPGTAAAAAYHMGEILFGDQQYARGIQAFRFAMEFGSKTTVFDLAQASLLNAITFMQAHFGEGSARAAVWHWIGLIQQGDMPEAWKKLDRNLRLALAQDWILANADHSDLQPYNKDDLAAALSAREPNHGLAVPFLISQQNKFQAAYGLIDVHDWGAAERRRTYKIEYELVILMETKGEELYWEPGMAARHTSFVMRRIMQEWLLAGFGHEIARPGWPPTPEVFPVEGVEFSDEPPPAPPGAHHFLHRQ